MKRVPISKFRERCSALLRQVQKTKKPIVITRFGKPLVKIVPAFRLPSGDWIGSMKDQIKILGDIVSPASEEADWEALRD